MIPKTIDIAVNCDCASHVITVPADRPKRWKYGPRCPGCGKVLGPMEWSIVKPKAARAAMATKKGEAKAKENADVPKVP